MKCKSDSYGLVSKIKMESVKFLLSLQDGNQAIINSKNTFLVYADYPDSPVRRFNLLGKILSQHFTTSNNSIKWIFGTV